MLAKVARRGPQYGFPPLVNRIAVDRLCVERYTLWVVRYRDVLIEPGAQCALAGNTVCFVLASLPRPLSQMRSADAPRKPLKIASSAQSKYGGTRDRRND